MTFTEVRSHEVIKRRTSKGATSGRVVRFGTAQVIGDIAPTGVPVIGDGRYCAFQLELAEITRGTFGRSGIALAKLADAMYAEYGLEPLLGTEVRGFQQMTPEPECDPLDGSVVARHKCYLSGGQVPALDEIATPASVYKTVTRYTVTTRAHRTRTRLAKPRPRKSEAQYIGQLITSADRPDAMFVGHQLVKRSPVRTRGTRKPRTVRISATTIEGALPTDHADLERAVQALKPGDRARFDHAGLNITITRAKSGKLNANVAGEQVARSARTEISVVRKVLAAIA